MRGAFSNDDKVGDLASFGFATNPNEGAGLEEKMAAIRQRTERHLMVAVF